MNHKILVVEDDLGLANAVTRVLTDHAFQVLQVGTLKEARIAFKQYQPEMVLLDWMLPDGQGVDLLREWRSEKHLLPILFMSARTEIIDRVLGLELGANDYLTKPFDPRELIARMRVLLRSPQQPTLEKKSLKCGDIEISLDSHEAFRAEVLISLTKMEFDLLKLFVKNPNKAFSREELLNKVWGYDQFPSTRTVDTHIVRLRQKFGEEKFETIRGVGYRFRI